MKMVLKTILKRIAGGMDAFFKLLIAPLKFVFRKFQLWDIDMQWSLHGGNCFSMLPPSFYRTHTKEEIDRMTEEKLEDLAQLLQELKKTEKEDGKKEKRRAEKKKRRKSWKHGFALLQNCYK